MTDPWLNNRDFPMRTESDWDAAHHQRHALLPTTARCETCEFWCRDFAGACAITLDLGLVEVKRPEDRCPCWREHVDYGVQMARALAGHPTESRKRSWETRRA